MTTDKSRAPRKNGASTSPPMPSGVKFQPGNPGRPKGARNRTTMAVQALLEGEAEALTRRAIDAALGGDSTALRLCLERIAPAPKDRTVQFEAPPVANAADIPLALAAILAAVAAGDLSPSEGATMATLIDKIRSAHVLDELERRLSKIEGMKT